MNPAKGIEMLNINFNSQTTVNDVSNKDLQYIFDFVALPQKLQLEKVCRRWRWLMPFEDRRLDLADFPIPFTTHSAWNHDGFPGDVRDVDKIAQLLELLICTKRLGRHLIELKIAEVQRW